MGPKFGSKNIQELSRVNRMKTKKYEMEIGGEKLTAEFSDLAENAHGSVILRLGDTTVLATAVMSKGEKDLEHFPLSV